MNTRKYSSLGYNSYISVDKEIPNVRKDVAPHMIYILTAAVPHNMQNKEVHRTVILPAVIHAVKFRLSL